jgi:hypothetical protein
LFDLCDLGLRLDLTGEVVVGCPDGLSAVLSHPLEAPVSTAAVIVLGILIWVVMAVLLALFLARMRRLGASVVELSLIAPVGKPVLDPTVEAKPVLTPTVEAIVRFPVKPTRFVGRVEAMAAASAALAPSSGRIAVVFHGMAGAGKTTSAVELAYRRQRDFVASAFWSAPTDPDQFGDALRLLAVALEAQLADYGVAMVEEIATPKRLEKFLPTLTDASLLLILDNLETLLTPNGQWRDRRWVPLIDALTGHNGPSRVILTSRIVPAGLNPDTVLIQPMHALSRKESLWLVRRLPNLRAVLHTVALGHRVLTLAQGRPTLLELADAAAADPPRLAYQLAEIEAAVDGAALAAFLTEGDTRLDAEKLLRIFTMWTITVAATAPAPARLLLQALCRIEETDRSTTVVGANWAALWRRWGQPGEPLPLASSVASLITAALITTDPIDDPADPNKPVHYRIHPGVVAAIHAATPAPVTAAVDTQLAAWWTAVVGGWEIEQQQTGKDTRQFMTRASLAAARYLLRQHDWNAASCLLERALIRDSYSPLTSLAVIPCCGASPRPPAPSKTSSCSAPLPAGWIPERPKTYCAAPTTEPQPTANTRSPPPLPVSWSHCCGTRAGSARPLHWPTRRSSTPARPDSGAGPNSATKAGGCRYSICSATMSRFYSTCPRCGPRWPTYPTSAPTTTA